jgi:hypothetical protein
MLYYLGCLELGSERSLLLQALNVLAKVFISTDITINTSSGDRNLCGHFSDFGAFEVAFDALLFDNCCAAWKDAIRLSYVK